MATLEDILTEVGATADFWATGGDAEQHAERDEAWDEFESLIRSLPKSEALAVFNTMLDPSHKVTYTFLAEIYAERGDAEAASKAYEKAAEAASKAQEALLRDYSDPADLCWLGYLLLQRCDADELPLCAHHFSGFVMEFGDDSRLAVSQHPFSDATVEGFSNEPETLRLATRAFGLAWLYYYKHSEKKSDAWHALPALDGLRAALFHADNFEALQVVSDTFWDWVEAWGFGTVPMCAEFVANFNVSTAYLRGRRKAAPLPVSEEMLRHLIRDEIHSGIEPVRGDIQAIRDGGEALHERLDPIVERSIDLKQQTELIWEQVRELAKKSPEAEKASIISGLEARLGHAWSALEPDSQDDLICARILSVEDCERGRLGWHYPAVGYGRVAERELKISVDQIRKRISDVPAKKNEMLWDLIEALRRLAKGAPDCDELSAADRLLLEERHVRRLKRFKKVRNRAPHPSKVTKADVLKMEELLLKPEDSGKPLIVVIVQARGSG